jgi:hypothetical protein
MQPDGCPPNQRHHDVARESVAAAAHRYHGRCPDALQPEARDPDCPACQALQRLEAARGRYQAALPTEEMITRGADALRELPAHTLERALQGDRPAESTIALAVLTRALTGAHGPQDTAIPDEVRERVMEVVAEEFGACSNVTADRILAAALQGQEESR